MGQHKTRRFHVERHEVWIEMRFLAKWVAWYCHRKANEVKTSRPGIMFRSEARGWF